MGYVLGLDGGGTKTVAVVVDEQGNILGQGRTGACNLQNIGVEGVLANLGVCVDECLRSAGLSRTDLGAGVFGVGGLDGPEDLAAYRRVISGLLPGIATAIENDAFIGLYSGTLGRPGIVAVAGTGSIVAGEDETGARGRAGGWGYLFGDEGSAFDIGRRAVIAALHDYDGRGPSTRLSGGLAAEAGVASLPDLLAFAYRQASPQTWVAGLARQVSEAAEAGDAVARGILRQAGAALGLAVRTLASTLSFPSRTIDLVLIGGAFRSPLVVQSLKTRLAHDDHRYQVIQPTWEPVVGALVKGLRMIGQPSSAEVERRLKEGLATPDTALD